jgi:hypothetical protein
MSPIDDTKTSCSSNVANERHHDSLRVPCASLHNAGAIVSCLALQFFGEQSQPGGV